MSHDRLVSAKLLSALVSNHVLYTVCTQQGCVTATSALTEDKLHNIYYFYCTFITSLYVNLVCPQTKEYFEWVSSYSSTNITNQYMSAQQGPPIRYLNLNKVLKKKYKTITVNVMLRGVEYVFRLSNISHQLELRH